MNRQPPFLKHVQRLRVPLFTTRRVKHRAFSASARSLEPSRLVFSTPPFLPTARPRTHPPSTPPIDPVESTLKDVFDALALSSGEYPVANVLLSGFNWDERKKAMEALEVTPEVPVPFEPRKVFEEQTLPACWVMPGRRLAVSAPVHADMSNDEVKHPWKKTDANLDEKGKYVRPLHQAIWCADIGTPVSCASWDLWIDLCELHGRDPGVITMRPFQSRTYEYSAADWKQLVRDPKSAAVLRNPYTNFTWSLPERDRFHVSYDPIWCFVGHRRLYIQPPYPPHPLVNILGADLNEIHGVYYFPVFGDVGTNLMV